MAESFDPARLCAERRARYAELAEEMAAVLEGERNATARMATVASMLHAAFADRFIWTGFYVVEGERELVVGPYQGALGCLRIAFGRGVCGAAAERGETLIVDDVEAFPDHIACDSRSRSEIVVPVRDPEGRLIAVLDVDSAASAAFDIDDRLGIEAIVARVFG